MILASARTDADIAARDGTAAIGVSPIAPVMDVNVSGDPPSGVHDRSTVEQPA